MKGEKKERRIKLLYVPLLLLTLEVVGKHEGKMKERRKDMNG